MVVQHAAVCVKARARRCCFACRLRGLFAGSIKHGFGALLCRCCIRQFLLRLRALGAHGHDVAAHRVQCGALAAQARFERGSLRLRLASGKCDTAGFDLTACCGSVARSHRCFATRRSERHKRTVLLDPGRRQFVLLLRGLTAHVAQVFLRSAQGGALALDITVERSDLCECIGQCGFCRTEGGRMCLLRGAGFLQARAGFPEFGVGAREIDQYGVSLPPQVLKLLLFSIVLRSGVGQALVQLHAASARIGKLLFQTCTLRLFPLQLFGDPLLLLFGLCQFALCQFKVLRFVAHALLGGKAGAHCFFQLLRCRCNLGTLGFDRCFRLLQFGSPFCSGKRETEAAQCGGRAGLITLGDDLETLGHAERGRNRRMRGSGTLRRRGAGGRASGNHVACHGAGGSCGGKGFDARRLRCVALLFGAAQCGGQARTLGFGLELVHNPSVALLLNIAHCRRDLGTFCLSGAQVGGQPVTLRLRRAQGGGKLFLRWP